MASYHQALSYPAPSLGLPFKPLTAIIVKSNESEEFEPNLLGLPFELRRKIWEYVFVEIQVVSSEAWYSPPVTPYDGLSLVCRKIYHETQREFFCRSLVPLNCLEHFMVQPFSVSMIQTVKKLSIQLPLSLPRAFFIDFVDILDTLSMSLEHLQLFFTGCDAYGANTYLHGCGNKMPSIHSSAQKLLIDGQEYGKRVGLMHQLSRMYRLKTLVVANANMPLLQTQLIHHKPKLEKLYIVYDPRTSLHVPYTMQNSGALLAPMEQKHVSRVKELQICTQAVIGAFQLVRRVCPTLEKLTWIVPDLSRQDGMTTSISTGQSQVVQPRLIDWHTDTSTVLNALALFATKLHTLRICVEGCIYEGHPSLGAFIGGFSAHLPGFGSLKKLELHIWSKSPYLGREIIRNLPISLERLYLSDRLIDVENLVDIVRRRAWNDEWARRIQLWGPFVDDLDVISREAYIIGEDLTSNDHVSFGICSLGFVEYEYDVDRDSVVAEQNRLAILRMNGWLLDLEHTRAHADRCDKHHRFKPVEDVNRIKADARALQHGMIEQQVKKEMTPRTDTEVMQNNLELMKSDFKDDPKYFGMEDAAEKVFRKERAVKVHEVVAKGWCMEVAVGDNDHWGCE